MHENIEKSVIYDYFNLRTSSNSIEFHALRDVAGPV